MTTLEEVRGWTEREPLQVQGWSNLDRVWTGRQPDQVRPTHPIQRTKDGPHAITLWLLQSAQFTQN